ncbi:MAG: ABC transporter permease [Candidatus Onthomonas sp.]
MTRTLLFAQRTAREILRDPINLFFGLGFPVILLLLLSAIQRNIPASLFEPATLTPGMALFGLSFLSLFSAQLIAKDRESAFLLRLFTTPLTPFNYILGYILPLLPMALAQSGLCYLTALFLGLEPSGKVLLAVLASLPASLVFLAVGLLCGSLLSVKAAGGLCGALLTNLTAWLSGAWFDVSLVGGPFEAVANALPFLHGTLLGRAILAGTPASEHLLWMLGYGIVFLMLAILAFRRQMHRV